MKRLVLLLIGLAIPAPALAVRITDYGWSCNGFLYCGSGVDAVAIITTNITVGVITIIGALAVIIFLYGAIKLVTSQGGEGKEAGKKAMIWASVGLVAAILAGGIINYVQQLIFAVAG